MYADITLNRISRPTFLDQVKANLPEGGYLDLCLTCAACSSGCPATGIDGMDPRKFLRMAVLGLDEEMKNLPWIWVCTQCQRCMYACPMQINIPELVRSCRESWDRESRPKGILQSCDLAFKNESSSAMGTPEDEFTFVVEDVLEETRESQPDFKDLQAPIDKRGAYYYLSVNSRNPVLEPEEMIPLWKIFHQVGADWTYSSRHWAGENYCMFLADDPSWEQIVRSKVKTVDDLGCKVWLNDECGHEIYAMVAGIKRFNIAHNFEIQPIVSLYAKWIREGKLPVNSDWNKDIQAKFTVQDPCQLIRKNFGDPVADDLRFVIKAVVGEENFVDMHPNKSNNFCCGGGGGSLQAPYTDQRRQYGKVKFDQIKATGANYCITPCHNCHSQILDLNEHFDGGFHTVHLWTLICLSLGILGEDEREYLGEDLKEVGL